MKLSLLLILLVSSLFSSTIEKKREITLYGKIDSRLYASLISVYRSFDPYEVEQTEENKECFRKDWNTATKKATLGYDMAEITPDKDGNYKVTIPIDYKGVNPCGYEYSSTKLQIQRNKNEKGFVNILILSSNKKLTNYRTKGSGSVGVKTIETDKKYLQLSSGSKIVCHTKHYQGISRRTKKYEEDTDLICEPMVASENNGTDELKSVKLNIDITVGGKSLLYHIKPDTIRSKRTVEEFREYKEPPTFFEKIKNFFSDII
ncbi:hypothetical protein [Halarcobacter sp.]|uniref:hypothetical protein n=1 Tax=Halarcobacter sp. TaxID=2321133 RepID=UPI003AFFCEE4